MTRQSDLRILVRAVAPCLAGLYLLGPMAAAAACIEVIDKINLPQEINDHGGIAAYEAHILERRGNTVQSIRNAEAQASKAREPDPYCDDSIVWDTGDSELDAEMQAIEDGLCQEEIRARESAARFYVSSIPVYRAALEVYDQILEELQCYAGAS